MNRISLFSAAALMAFTMLACDGSAQSKIDPQKAASAALTAGKHPVATLEKGGTYDFGQIKRGKRVKCSFVIKNTGEVPLVILNGRSSCGCTVPEWPKNPIPPGGTGEVKVTYDGSGMGRVKKSITLETNTERGREILYILGEVVE